MTRVASPKDYKGRGKDYDLMTVYNTERTYALDVCLDGSSVCLEPVAESGNSILRSRSLCSTLQTLIRQSSIVFQLLRISCAHH